MAKIVIDIDDKTYKAFTELIAINLGRNLICKGIIGKCLNAIKHGKVLPKGYGRLGDLDALYEEMVNGIKAGNYEEGFEHYANINNVDDCVEAVRYADTIIEADKEERE